MIPSNIIETNVNCITGDVLLTCSYSPQIDPNFFRSLSKGRQTYSYCPELHHLDILGFKLCTVFRLGRLESLTVLTKDGSPHSMQIPLMVQEAAEDTAFCKDQIRYFCLEDGNHFEFSDLAVRKARHFSEIEELLPFSKVKRVVEILRGPGGCPNDQQETLATVVEHLKEEVAEVDDAFRSGDHAHFVEEIGDLLFNVVLLGRILEEGNRGSIQEIAEVCSVKMIERHQEQFNERQRFKY